MATATRGEQGMLGTNGQVVTRADLPRVREAELRTVLQLYGARPPIFLGYRDREMAYANADELTAKIAAVMAAIKPDVDYLWAAGALGPSRPRGRTPCHGCGVSPLPPPHHCTTTPLLQSPAARSHAGSGPHASVPRCSRLCSSILRPRKRSRYALRTYTTQEDAQRLAAIEQSPWAVEAFHQAYPTDARRGFGDRNCGRCPTAQDKSAMSTQGDIRMEFNLEQIDTLLSTTRACAAGWTSTVRSLTRCCCAASISPSKRPPRQRGESPLAGDA